MSLPTIPRPSVQAYCLPLKDLREGNGHDMSIRGTNDACIGTYLDGVALPPDAGVTDEPVGKLVEVELEGEVTCADVADCCIASSDFDLLPVSNFTRQC